MKYWLFDGNDVVGPFTPQELMKRADFSASSLICAEDSSQDSAGWQMACLFDEFTFNQVANRSALHSQELTENAAVPVTAQVTPAPQPEVTTPEKQTQHPVSSTPTVKKAPAEKKPVAKTPLTKTSQPAPKSVASSTKQDLAPVRLSGVKAPQEPAGPVALAKENVELVLPVETDLASSQKQQLDAQPQPSPADSSSKTEEQPAKQSAQKSATSAQPAPQKEVPESSLVEPETEIISTCTLPLVNEILTQSDLPRLPEDNFHSVALPAEPEFELKELEPEVAEASAEPEELPQAASPVANDVFATPAQGAPSTEEPQSLFLPEEALPSPAEFAQQPEPDLPAKSQTKPQDAAPEVAQPQLANDAKPVDGPVSDPQEETPQEIEELTAPSLPQTQQPNLPRPSGREWSEIKKSFVAAPAQEDFILEQRLFSKPAPAPKKWPLSALLLLILALMIGGGLWWWGGRSVPNNSTPAIPETKAENSAAKPAKTPAPEKAAKPAKAATKPASTKPVTPAAAPKQMTASDKALAAVQNYKLPGNKGTISSYFNKIYQPNLEQGYTATWSVEPLHKSTYIVKYRLTKTRMEPIVYVFQADAARGQVTGALNNIALDLIGRI